MQRICLLTAFAWLVPATAFAADAAPVVQKTVHVGATKDAISKAACAMDPHVTLASSTRALDVRVDGRACLAEAEAEAVAVMIDTSNGDVTLSTVVADPNAADDLRAIIDAAASLLTSNVHRDEAISESRRTEHATPEAKRTWYGVQTIVVDVIAAASCGTLVLCPLGLGLYLFGSPAVHWAHGHGERGFASLGLRFAFPAVGFAIGYGMSEAHPARDFGQVEAVFGLLIGALAGAAIMPIVDAAIAYDEPRPPKSIARIWPTFAPSAKGGSVGLSGAF